MKYAAYIAFVVLSLVGTPLHAEDVNLSSQHKSSGPEITAILAIPALKKAIPNYSLRVGTSCKRNSECVSDCCCTTAGMQCDLKQQCGNGTAVRPSTDADATQLIAWLGITASGRSPVERLRAADEAIAAKVEPERTVGRAGDADPFALSDFAGRPDQRIRAIARRPGKDRSRPARGRSPRPRRGVPGPAQGPAAACRRDFAP